jgi:flagellar protein FlaJ
MPRVTKQTFLYSWLASLGVAGFLGFIALVFFYAPFLEYVFRHPITNFPKDTILKLNAIKILDLNLNILHFVLVIDIMDITWFTLFFLFLFPAYYYRKDHIWRNKIDSYLPYLLREISDAQKVGLPLPRAILEASKRQYGPLTEELKLMASKISWGVPFGDCLRDMAANINTLLFKRTAVLILEAERSGGQTDEIFESAYVHVTELLGLERERLSSMSPYKWIILISFVVFAFIIVVLLNSFFVELAIKAKNIPQGQAQTSGFGGLPLNLALLQLIFYHILVIEGASAGIIASKMSTGNVKIGLINALIMVSIGYIIFKLGAIIVG